MTGLNVKELCVCAKKDEERTPDGRRTADGIQNKKNKNPTHKDVGNPVDAMLLPGL